VSASTLKIEATTEWFGTPTGSQQDVDYELLDPDGNVIATSGGPAGASEFVSVAVTRPGTYTHRVVGFTNAATDFTITTRLSKGSAPPALQAVAGEFTNAQGRAVDFDAAFTLNWQASGGETGFEIERSSDGTNYSVISSVAGDRTSLALADQPNGDLSYRVRALTPGQIGSYVTPSSNVSSILVDRRGKVDITGLISTTMSNVSFTGGVFKLDLNVRNNSTSTYVPFVELNVVRITSTSNTVSVKNADNAGDGRSAATAALFGYSSQLGSDQLFSPAEATSNRTLQFNDAAAEMFSFDVRVTAFQNGANPAQGGSPAGAPGAGSGSNPSNPLNSLPTLNGVMRITVNPVTKSVTAKLLK
jgi:hypothetical protein